jgi:hypothetical protein
MDVHLSGPLGECFIYPDHIMAHGRSTPHTAVAIGISLEFCHVGRSDNIPLWEIVIPLRIHDPHDPDLHPKLVDLELGSYARTGIETETALGRIVEGLEWNSQDDWEGC